MNVTEPNPHPETNRTQGAELRPVGRTVVDSGPSPSVTKPPKHSPDKKNSVMLAERMKEG